MLQRSFCSLPRIAGLHGQRAIWARRPSLRRFVQASPGFGAAAWSDLIEINDLSEDIQDSERGSAVSASLWKSLPETSPPMTSTPRTRLFRRFLAEDPAATMQEIAADRLRLEAARERGDQAAMLAIATGIGFGLYITGNEAEAAPMLENALALARQLGDRSAEIEALLHLATARQYLGERDQAQALFKQALDRSEAYGIDAFVHFILHHQGRCFAEQGRIEEARRSFERALPLRERLGNPRFINSTRAALVDLADW